MLISERHIELNRELHRRNPTFGTSGKVWSPGVLSFAEIVRAESILDYGAGRGTLVASFPCGVPYRVVEYDPAVDGKMDRPAPADVVVCGDVLEHIEPECLDDVLDDLHFLTQKGIFLVIGTHPAMKTLADGRNAHLIVKPARWWLERIWDRWNLHEFHDYGPTFQCTAYAR